MIRYFPLILRALLVLTGVTLLAEFVMSTSGGSLCPTDVCLNAAEILPINKSWLYVGGLVWLTCATLCFDFGNQSRKHLLLGIVAFAGIPFEGALLGNLISRGTPCVICLLVAASVFVVIILIWLRLRTAGVLAATLWVAAIAGGFLVSGQAPVQTTDLRQSSVIKIRNVISEIPSNRQYHLFIRLDCPHCQHVLEALEEADLRGGDWYVHVPGGMSTKDQQRLVFAINQSDKKSLKSILAAKTIGSEYLPSVTSALVSEMKSKGQHSLQQQINLGSSGVPMLVVDSPGMRIVLTGSDGILSILNRKSK